MMLPRANRRALSGALLRVALVADCIAVSAGAPRAAGAGVPARSTNLATARSIAGDVRERISHAPIPGATVLLQTRSGATLAIATTSAGGSFAISAADDDSARISVRATGYEDSSLALGSASSNATVHVLLARQQGLRRIGMTAARAADGGETVRGAGIGPESLAVGSDMRVADALAALPGLTVSGDALAPGGDAYVSRRGLRPGETQTLLDGHPIGPIGVAAAAPDADGTVAGFNYQDAPYFALRSVDVTSGAVAADLFGAGGVGGTIDLHTFDPTRRTELFAAQSTGTRGRTSTALRATGTIGKFGYAFAHGVMGTDGLFDNVAVAQTGLRGSDFTSATLRGLTYDVSGAYVLRNELAKIVYAVDARTSLAFSAYDATSWSDKTGEGDNDFIPYAYALANAPVGENTTCPHGVVVITDAGSRCLAARTYALGAEGPAGGGPGAWQALRNQDYDLRLRRSSDESTVTLETFADSYALLYHRDPSLAGGQLDAFLDRWSTLGLRLDAETVAKKNAVRYGVAFLREALNEDATTPGGIGTAASLPNIRNDRRAFASDTFSPARRVSLSLGATLATSDGDPALRFDPRASAAYRPSSHDSLSVSVGRSTQEPSLQTGRVDLLPTGALNPDCGALAHATKAGRANVTIGSGPATNLVAESSLDSELEYARTFGRDTFTPHHALRHRPAQSYRYRGPARRHAVAASLARTDLSADRPVLRFLTATGCDRLYAESSIQCGDRTRARYRAQRPRETRDAPRTRLCLRRPIDRRERSAERGARDGSDAGQRRASLRDTAP